MKLPNVPPFAFHSPAEAAETVARWKTEAGLSASCLVRCASAEIQWTQLVIYEEEESAHVGMVDLALHESRQTLGFSLWMAPPFRQKGFARTVGEILLETAWEQRFARVETAHVMGVPGASELAEGLGLLPEGVQRGALPGPGGRIDVAHWGRLASD